MAFFRRRNSDKRTQSLPQEYDIVLNFRSELNDLMKSDQFVARSDYSFIIEKYRDISTFFENLNQADMLQLYCKKNSIPENKISLFLDLYCDLKDLEKGSSIIKKHNDWFIENHLKTEKDYLDNVLKAIDESILLDDDQRRVVLSDEDYTLVIAGAGAGKTTTVAAKVKYLVDKKRIDPNKILVISFTNKAVNELKAKINDSLGINCPITTFHKTGYAILRKQESEKLNIYNPGFLYDVVNNYIKTNVFKQPEMIDKIILFFGSYFDAPYEGDDLEKFFKTISTADYSTMKANLPEYADEIIDKYTRQKKTINSEILRSYQEVRIANFLFLNQIDYKYEAPYEYHILKARKPYTPDFLIKQGDNIAYIEHFGITEGGQNNRYKEEDLEKYKNEIRDKIRLHKQHGTKLLYTFSSYNDGRDFLDHLKEQLENNGFILNPRSTKEVLQKIVSSEENKYISRFVKLITNFIVNYKTNGFGPEEFKRMIIRSSNVRTKLFLEICQQCYFEYQKQLNERGAVDFEDMINMSANLLKEQELLKQKLDFEYIIVDEYQDISRQRFDLTKNLSNVCDAKIIAVGDDWQSIYGYAGSDITLFTQFCKTMGYGSELKITKTYRNAQEVIDIAGSFIQKNKTQIQKSLISPKHILEPIVVKTYSEYVDRRKTQGHGGVFYEMGKVVESTIESIIEQNSIEGKSCDSSILLLGRYGFDAYNFCKSDDFLYNDQTGEVKSRKFPNVKLEYLTAHRSKGLGYDNVIIVNARDATYGFPSKIDDDPIMKLVTRDDHSIEYAEERRLFYVALTRTKNRVYIITPKENPSEFVLELINNYKNVSVDGDLKKRSSSTSGDRIKKCPVCGYPLQLRYKMNYGLRLWLCTNDPEVCGFITNKLTPEKLQIQKCEKCRNGYLIVREGPSGYFLGCTNYKDDHSGCNNTKTPEEFYESTSATSPKEEFGSYTSVYNPSERNEEKASQKLETPIVEYEEKENSSWNNTTISEVDKTYGNFDELGFCINCGVRIPFNPQKPLCSKCFSTEDYSSNEAQNKRRAFCHRCGLPNGRMTFLRPLDYKCWKKVESGKKKYWNAKDMNNRI